MELARPALALAALLLTAAACRLPAAAPQPPAAAAEGAALAARLTVHTGCDETFVARDPQKTVILAVDVPGILGRARRAGLPYRERLALGERGIVVRLERGADLDHWCNDVLERPPRIDAVWLGIEGTATVEVSEERGGSPPAGTTRPPPAAAVVRLGRSVLAREHHPDERLALPPLEIAATLGVAGGG